MMQRSGLASIRLRENLVLDNDPKVFISGRIVQYLLNHQLSGVRFLYKNVKNHKSAILNDDSGTGKLFQCVAFFDAVLKTKTPAHILVICQNKQSLDLWHYCIDTLLENVPVVIADFEPHFDQSTSTMKRITLVSSSYALIHLDQLKTIRYDYLVIQDQHLQLSTASLERLKEIQASHKLILCSINLFENLSYFYAILKFSNENDPVLAASSKGKILTETEFRTKYGCRHDRSISKRNQIFRQQNLSNACNDFYLRRLTTELGKHYPPINAEVFQTNYREWKDRIQKSVAVEDTIDCSGTSLSSVEWTKTQKDPITYSNDDEDDIPIPDIACTDDLNDFDTQMSPLIYYDSDSDDGENAENSPINVIQSSSESSQQMTPDIACNQEHAAKVKHSQAHSPTKKTTPRKSSTTNNNKRMSYKQLSITINSNNRDSQNIGRRSHVLPGTTDLDSQKRNISRRISSTSDIQVISEKSDSPITISSNSQGSQSQMDITHDKDPTELETQLHTNELCMSPDLFSSFNSTRTDIPNENETNSTKQQTKSKTMQDLFGAPDECDDIDLSNSNVDIFEITKNNVFENVLCSAKDKITPTIPPESQRQRLSEKTKYLGRNSNCLSGLRVAISKLDDQQIKEIQNRLQSKSQSQQVTVVEPNPNDTIDLTNTQIQDDVQVIDSDEVKIIRDVERTPERKRELTPSTRSCLKRNSVTKNESNEKKRRTPSSSGWFTTRSSPKVTGTPLSRRRLDKWLTRTTANNVSEDSSKVSKPRNLFKEFKSNRSSNRIRNKCAPSTSIAAHSPNIFSDQDD